MTAWALLVGGVVLFVVALVLTFARHLWCGAGCGSCAQRRSERAVRRRWRRDALLAEALAHDWSSARAYLHRVGSRRQERFGKSSGVHVYRARVRGGDRVRVVLR
ncbi:hypothetical protein LFM09_44495 [Lentzea alba]|uniref:hypothetical protein n=1 Tax=Lentzea alba TaxID=2714351 RepID=UPI0039BF3A72